MKQGSGVSYIHGLKDSDSGVHSSNIVNKVRDSSSSLLMQLLQAMFDGIDDSFFELANAAYSNNEQNRYFEAMREVRIKRKGIEGYFQQELIRLFRTPPELRHGSTRNSAEDVPLESLTLVQDDALEESVAINSMTSKSRANFPGQLLQFQTRISQVFGRNPDQNAVNPLDPEYVCKAFSTACGTLDIDIREKLIVYKQFDRYVLTRFGEVLEEANRLLIQAGVLPNLKYSTKKSRLSQKPTASPTDYTSGIQARAPEVEDEGEDIFPQILGLLDALRQSNRSQFERIVTGGSGNAHIVGDQELFGLLSQLQKQTPFSDLTDGPIESVNLRSTILQLLTEQSDRSGQPSALNQIDEDLINLVSMLFEFILDDYNLSAPIQVLISRLQIPILKVVMKDKTFFSRTSHPARKLLNSLAKAGIGWSDISEKKRDKLYEQINSVVQRILEEFDGNVDLFEELYQQFASFIAREERKAKLVEQRTKETEEGRIKSQKAQVVVDQVLTEKINSFALPAVAVDLLRNGWSRVMFLAFLKDDIEHHWNQSVKTVDELIWCLQPHTDNEDRQRWVKVVPQLLKTLKLGLKEVSYNTSKLDQMLVDLKKALTETFKQQSASAAIKDAPKPVVRKAEEAERPRIKTAVERQKEVEDAAVAEYLSKIDVIPNGTWIEFALVNGSKFRCKLSTKVDNEECFIFVNRMGLKVVEKTRYELAHEMRRGRIRVLEEGLLLDRAMHTVMSNLRRAAS